MHRDGRSRNVAVDGDDSSDGTGHRAVPSTFLPGIPEDLVRLALASAGGNEIESGKFDSPESSAALAVNALGWFIERPTDLLPFPPLTGIDWPATHVAIERQMRFPWRGGRHPWLDAAVETEAHLIHCRPDGTAPTTAVSEYSLPAPKRSFGLYATFSSTPDLRMPAGKPTPSVGKRRTACPDWDRLTDTPRNLHWQAPRSPLR